MGKGTEVALVNARLEIERLLRINKEAAAEIERLRIPVGTNAYHCTPDTPQIDEDAADIADAKAAIAENKWVLWCETHDKPMTECQPDTPQSVPADECRVGTNPFWCLTHNAPWAKGHWRCTPRSPQSVPALVEASDMANALSSANMNIASLIAERDKLKEELEQQWHRAEENEHWYKVTQEKLEAAEADSANKMVSMLAERDKLLKDRSDLAKQIDNDTDLIAKLKEADGLDILPTLAKAYKEIAKLKEEVEREHALNRPLVSDHARLVERVSVLEKALEQYANMEKEGDPPCWRGTPYLARAALRTSEDAK